MKFVIENEVFELLPDLVIGIPLIKGFDNTKGKDNAVKFLRNTEATLRETMTLDQFWQDQRITSYGDAFKKFGTDPEIRRPAHIALAKRILEGGHLPDINPIVNIYNAISLKHLTPFGGENLDVLKGDFRLFIAKGGEQWIPIGGDKAKPALKGELVWGDDIDLSTRALNWRQCERTKMTDKTKNGFFVMDGFVDVNKQVMEEASKEFIAVATQLCGGEASMYWMDRENCAIITNSL
ncbi:MAG: phenylalanine--tRNA ligase beta subunit-related protein [Patescibacteria group bacterium]